MYYLLLKAYYDITGNFDRITDMFFGNLIIEAAEKENVTVDEFCYRWIGFIADNTYSAAERMHRRALATDMKNEKFLDIFPPETVKKSMLKANNILPFFTKRTLSIPEWYKDVVETIVNFIEHTDMLSFILDEKGSTLPLRDIFFKLKLAKNEKQLNEMIKEYLPLVKRIIPYAKTVDNIEHSYASAGKILLSSNLDDLDRLAIDVCLHIGRRSFVMPSTHYYFILRNLMSYQFLNSMGNDVYLKLMDLSNIYDMTIAELIQYAGFSYVNQFQVYSHSGHFLYWVSDSKFLCVDPFNLEERFERTFAEYRMHYSNLTFR